MSGKCLEKKSFKQIMWKYTPGLEMEVLGQLGGLNISVVPEMIRTAVFDFCTTKDMIEKDSLGSITLSLKQLTTLT